MARCSGSSRGFTLVELLVSLAVIGVITGAMLANFRGGQRSAEVRLASDILVATLREMQTNALSGRLVNVCSGGVNDLKVCEQKTPPVACTGGTCQRRVPTGYGVRISVATPKNFIVFYDTDGDAAYDAGEEISSPPYVSTATVVFDSSNVAVPVDIVYKPPSAQLFVNGSSAGPDTVRLTIKHDTGSPSRNVTLYRTAGKIEHD